MSEDNRDNPPIPINKQSLRQRYQPVRPYVKKGVEQTVTGGEDRKNFKAIRKGAFLAAEAAYEEATRDETTGILNRKGLEERLKIELARARRGKPLSYIFFDLNDLKQINDKKGHKAGDILLKGFANVLNDQSREVDIVARWGGDEFVVVLPDTNTEGAVEYFDRINPLLNDQNIKVAAGISLVDPTNEATIAESRRLADAAMYIAKEESKRNETNTVMLASELSTEQIMASDENKKAA